jgi:hypothetical protein
MDDLPAATREVGWLATSLAVAVRMAETAQDAGPRWTWEGEVQRLTGRLAQVRREWWAAGGTLKLVQK